MTAAELAQAAILFLAASVDAWRGAAIAGLALAVIGLVGLAHAWWSEL